MNVKSDLRYMFGNIRDQGPRPTCLAFAVSDVHASIRPGSWQPLSCEYAYYHAVQSSHGDPRRGVDFDSILKAIRITGQPHEIFWPYLKTIPSDLSLWVPPPNISPLFCRESENRTNSVSDIINCIDSCTPVVIGMTISNAFYQPGSGGVIDSNEPLDPTRRHAVVGLGHGTREQERLLLVRNSWGGSWGEKGYAWVTERYLTPRLISYVELTKDLTN